MKRVSVWVDINVWDVDAARDAIAILLEVAGVPWNWAEGLDRAEVIYSRIRPTFARTLWLPAGVLPKAERMSEPVWRNGVPILVDTERSGGSDIYGDIVLGTHAIVSGWWEKYALKDAWHVPVAKGGQFLPESVVSIPVVGCFANVLKQRIENEINIVLTCEPAWPSGKKSAIVLTHDVDKPISGFDVSFRSAHLRKVIRDRNFSEIPKRVLAYLMSSASYIGSGKSDIKDDPNFGFWHWAAAERKFRTTSAFYVAMRRSVDPGGAPNDVAYDARRSDFTKELRNLAAQGWEIGLHPSIRAWEEREQMASERTALAAVLGVEPRGVRHHFWSLGPCPNETLEMLADTGFSYDSSLGLNDVPGFRRGMAWPFRPWNNSKRRPVTITQLPPTCMDGSLYTNAENAAAGGDRLFEHLKIVHSFGGAAVLNWHLENANPHLLNGAGPGLLSTLTKWNQRDDVWWCSPLDLLSWRANRLKRLTSSN